MKTKICNRSLLFLLAVLCSLSANGQLTPNTFNLEVGYTGGYISLEQLIYKTNDESFPSSDNFEFLISKAQGDIINFTVDGILQLSMPEYEYRGGYYYREFDLDLKFPENKYDYILNAQYKIYYTLMRGKEDYGNGTLTLNIIQYSSSEAIGEISPSISTVHSGKSVTLDYEVFSRGAIQWQEFSSGMTDWTNIPGAKGDSYTRIYTNNGTSNIQYRYRVINTYGGKESMSNYATVTVIPAPRAGNIMPLTQNVDASSVQPLFHYGAVEATSLQWQKLVGSNWVDIAGETCDYFSHPVNSAVGAYQYRIKINASSGAILFTPPATIYYGAEGSGTSDLSGGFISPASQNVNSGNPASILTVSGVTGGGTSAINYQWQKSSDGIRYDNISGATGTAYSPGAVTTDTYFRVASTCNGKTVYSNYAIIYLSSFTLSAGEVTPATQKILTGKKPLSLSLVSVSGGSGTTDYQWQRSSSATGAWSDISSATKISYLPEITDQTYYYRVKISNSGQTAYSQFCMVEVVGNSDNSLSWSKNENSIVKRVSRIAASTISNNIVNEIIDVTYYDGLGRTKQLVEVGASPTRTDIVTPFECDNMGRNDAKRYLPYTITTGEGILQSDALSAQKAFYTTHFGVNHASRAFVEKTYEKSPLNRVKQEAKPGDIYGQAMYRDDVPQKDVSTPVQFAYGGNTSEDLVYFFDVNPSGRFSVSKYHMPNSLYKTVVEDEDKLCLTTFTDLSGRTLLERRYHTYDPADKQETYYLYDALGRLRVVLPPLATINIRSFGTTYTGDEVFLQEFAYKYLYDSRGNVIEKKLPGRDWEYFVYDRGDRVVMSQDGKMRKNGEWIYTVYDNFNRMVSQSLVRGGLSRNEIQTKYNALTDNIYPHAGNAANPYVPFSDFTLLTVLSEDRYGGYEYLTGDANSNPIDPNNPTPLSPSGSGLFKVPVSSNMFIKYDPDGYNVWGNNFEPYTMKNGEIDPLFFICNESYPPDIKYYYVPTLGAWDNFFESVGLVSYPGKYTLVPYPGSGAPASEVVAPYPADWAFPIPLRQKTDTPQTINVDLTPNMYLSVYLPPSDLNFYLPLLFSENGSIRNEFKMTGTYYEYYIPAQYKSQIEWLCQKYPMYLSLRFPGTGTPKTTVQYQDNYTYSFQNNEKDYLAFSSVGDIVSESDVDDRTTGLLIYEKKAVLDGMLGSGGQSFIERAFYYDYKGRVVQTVEKNHLGYISRYSTKYDFVGNILTACESHQVADGTADKLLTQFAYDHRSRLLSETTTLNGGDPATVAYSYNELGQLAGKEYGMNAAAAPFSVSYKYNLQGWLEKQSSAHFTMDLEYFAQGHVSGNIYGVRWSHPSGSADERLQKNYRFSYDYFGRLSEAASLPGNFNEKEIFYDRNGNILHLRRTDNSTTLDNLTYAYTGNKLTALSDIAGNFTYDQNGNMITNPAENLTLSYNYLNLISEVADLGNVSKARYTWLADGTKTGVVGADGKGFEYLGSLIYTRTGEQLELESAAFGGGRIIASHSTSGSFYEPTYFITDHLGSTRIVVDGSGNVKEQNDYYAFGLRWDDPDSRISDNRFLYNGKELQTTGGLGYLDYGARMYDSRLGRWFGADPMAEKYTPISPYVYCLNNPIKFIDVKGKHPAIPLIWWALGGASAGAGAAAAAASASAAGSSLRDVNWTGIKNDIKTAVGMALVTSYVSFKRDFGISDAAVSEQAADYQTGAGVLEYNSGKSQDIGLKHLQMVEKYTGSGDYGGGGDPPNTNNNKKWAVIGATVGLGAGVVTQVIDPTGEKFNEPKKENQDQPQNKSHAEKNEQIFELKKDEWKSPFSIPSLNYNPDSR